MICVGLSDILYPSDTFGENSCIVNGLIVAVCACGHVAFNRVLKNGKIEEDGIGGTL